MEKYAFVTSSIWPILDGSNFGSVMRFHILVFKVELFMNFLTLKFASYYFES